MSMSASSFMLVLGIMVVTILAIYATLFSVGTGFGEKADRWIEIRNVLRTFGYKEKADKTVPPAKAVSKPQPHEMRHAA